MFTDTLHTEKEVTLEGCNTTSTPLYLGGTGCGKTYRAISQSQSFVISVPTRQLAYEIALDYKEKISDIHTGEVHLGDGSMNMVCVYENLNDEVINKYDTLIVDEAHFLGDEQRGALLLQNIVNAKRKGKEVILLTATDTIPKELKEALSIKEEILTPYKKVQKIELEEIGDIQNLLKREPHLKVLVFTKYSPNQRDLELYSEMLGVDIDKTETLSANIPTAKRLKTQIAFKKGELQMVVSSNVLAQGVNFPADIVLIEYNEWDEWEIVQQKIGRAGRPQFCDKAYYFLHHLPTKEVKEANKVIRKTTRVTYRGISIQEGGFEDFEIPTNRCKEYRNFKYSKRFFLFLKRKGIKLLPHEEKAYRRILKEEYKVKEILK